MRAWIGAAMIMVLCAGCISFKTEVKYLTLDMRPTGKVECKRNLHIEAIRIGEALSRKEVFILTKPTEVEYYASSQWAAGADQLVREKLETEFGAPKHGRPTTFMTVEVLAFGQADTAQGADAIARVRVSFHSAAAAIYETPQLEQVYEEREHAAKPAASAVAPALSRCIERIAARIAADANTLPAPPSPGGA